jgi:hypothetical protein
MLSYPNSLFFRCTLYNLYTYLPTSYVVKKLPHFNHEIWSKIMYIMYVMREQGLRKRQESAFVKNIEVNSAPLNFQISR